MFQSAIDILVMKEAKEEADSFMAIGCKQQTLNQLIKAISHENIPKLNRTLITW